MEKEKKIEIGDWYEVCSVHIAPDIYSCSSYKIETEEDIKRLEGLKTSKRHKFKLIENPNE